MVSDNKTVMKAVGILTERIGKLKEKRLDLWDSINEKYPYDAYGLKGQMLFEEKKKDLNDEINLLTEYVKGMYDLIDIIEGKGNR